MVAQTSERLHFRCVHYAVDDEVVVDVHPNDFSQDLLDAEKIAIAGLPLTRLKKLKGARLSTPSLLKIDIQPTGLGTTQALSGECGRPWSCFVGS